MSEYRLTDESRAFANKIVFLCRKMKSNGTEYPLTSQLLRCGTSIGANCYEAQYAQGTNDFISKLEIALKECNETQYWLSLLHDTGDIDDDSFNAFNADAGTIRRVLISSIRTSKQNLSK